MDVRGYDRDGHQRIERFVRESERTAAPLRQPSRGQLPFRVRRVILDDDLLLETPTTGRERVRDRNREWITTDVQFGGIYKDNPTLGYLGEGDEVWVLPQGGNWYAIAEAAKSTADRVSVGCCGACIRESSLLIAGRYALRYKARDIPDELGGPIVTLQYIGLTSGLPGITDNFFYWESDTFDFDCGTGVDQYLWRMVVGADGTSTCKASWGEQNVFLYLVHVGSATVCGELDTAICPPGGTVFPQYSNKEDWRARCGSRLYILMPQRLHSELKRLLRCSVCVAPATPTDETPDEGDDGGGGPCNCSLERVFSLWDDRFSQMVSMTYITACIWNGAVIGIGGRNEWQFEPMPGEIRLIGQFYHSFGDPYCQARYRLYASNYPCNLMTLTRYEATGDCDDAPETITVVGSPL